MADQPKLFDQFPTASGCDALALSSFAERTFPDDAILAAR
jgi:hypothetical protein